jgi:tetratricopeptide (TPR) repeat protein
MEFTTFVAFLLLTTQCMASDTLEDAVRSIENDWSSIYYQPQSNNKLASYDKLLEKTKQLTEQFPRSSETLFWKAVILATEAEHQDGFTALQSINQAKDLLEEAISINPKTANGSAYVTLGTLYYMTPKWPIAFGDNQKAEELYKQALQINPDGLDANYFYGEFLLSNNQPKSAQYYLEKALTIPSRKEQFFADDQLKLEVKQLLANNKSRRLHSIKNTFMSLFNSASLK